VPTENLEPDVVVIAVLRNWRRRDISGGLNPAVTKRTDAQARINRGAFLPNRNGLDSPT
jgi:hypothetical protein